MTCSLTISLVLALFPAVRPSHAAKKPHARGAEEGAVIWTNGDLDCVLTCGEGAASPAVASSETWPTTEMRPTQDPQWYAEQASKLRRSSASETMHSWCLTRFWGN
jgi:hypothetical protein